MNNIKDFLDILECPKCRNGDLRLKQDLLECSGCGARYGIIDGIADFVIKSGDKEICKDGISDVSLARWDEFHNTEDRKKDDIGFGAMLEEHLEIFKNLNLLQELSPHEIILDIGCGRGYMSYGLSKLGKIPVGIDYVFEALLFAKRKFEKENLPSLFIRADMCNLPFKKESFKFIYSLGVLEHHRSIAEPVREIFRTLKCDGLTFNVVPALSISSLTYGQLWGSIPNFFMLKDIFYWFHHKLLRGRHCIYGYELNYLESQLKKIFKSSGFGVNKSGIFGIAVPIYSIKNRFLKSLAKRLIKNRLFTRHIYIQGEKR